MRAVLRRLDDGLLRGRAVRDARAALATRAPAQERAFEQARLLLEVAQRIAEPVERLPAGSRAAVLMRLYRDAAYWALIAARTADAAPPTDLRALWAETPPATFANVAPEPTLAAIRATLVDPVGPAPLDTTGEDAARARAFVAALLADLEAPRARLDRLLTWRWLRIGALGGLLVALLWGARALLLGPNLADGKPFRASTSWSGCVNDPPCTALMFHTEDQERPWVEIDLGAARAIRRIEVSNRTDCCSDRAVPMIAEVSTDSAHWTEVGRREKDFKQWTLKFPTRSARYVKLTVPRRTVLHLKSVAVR